MVAPSAGVYQRYRNAFGMLAGSVGAIADGYQLDMERLIDLIEVQDEHAAEAHLSAFFARVDANLLSELEWVLEAASLSAPLEKAVHK